MAPISFGLSMLKFNLGTLIPYRAGDVPFINSGMKGRSLASIFPGGHQFVEVAQHLVEAVRDGV